MAIQDIETSHAGSSTTGFKREIDKGAMGLVLDTIQITQYTKPEESTVRELTANAVDSQREKEIAISILKGESTPEDHYISREGDKYKDSNWDASYYDLKYLNTEKNKVELEYVQNEGTGYCDQFIVRDHGVGLGMDRLEGYFSIGYSTKRNSKGSLGAFGFGNKVALSTRCDFYTITTVHNGKKFKFNCYSYKIDSLIGKFSNDGINKSITFENGQEIFYEETDEKNYSEVVVPTKRHHRIKYEQSIPAQLLYFSTVKFTIIHEDGYRRGVPVAANVLYSSERLVISENNQFSRPHIVIVKSEKGGDDTGVCYGYIDFREMEMEELWGNVGIKCPIRSVIRDEVTGKETVLQEGVEVTPSRETVIWSENTRNFIKSAFAEAVEEATTIIESKLQENDFLKWIQSCASVINTRAGSDKVLTQLSKVIDTSGIKPKFKDTGIKYTDPHTMYRGFKVRINRRIYDNAKKKNIIDRSMMHSWSEFNVDKVYIKTSCTSATKDSYIHTIEGNFITIEPMTDDELNKRYRVNDTISANLSVNVFNKLIASKDELWNLTTSSENVKSYEDIEVPEDFITKFEEVEDEAAIVAMSAAERRKLEAKIPIYGLYNKVIGYLAGGSDTKWYVWKQKDTKITDLQEDEALMYYGTAKDDKMLHLVGFLLKNQLKAVHEAGTYFYDNNHQYFNENIKIIKISKQNEKYIKQCKNAIHVKDFFSKTTGINE